MIVSMTARDLNLAIKRGTTVEELLLEYDCTNDEFDNRMDSLYPNEKTKQRKMRDLASNAKKHRKVTPPAESSAEENVPDEVQAEELPAEAEYVAPATESVEVATMGSLLEAILTQKKKLSQLITQKKDELNQLELVHKDYAQARSDIRSTLLGYHEKLSRLYDEYLSLQKMVEEKTAELNDYAAKMFEINDPITAIREDITRLEEEYTAGGGSVEIFAFSSGEIQFNDTKITEFEGWEMIYQELRSRDDWDDRLSFLQLKQLAKLIVMIQQLEAKGLTFDIMFDSDVLEDAYHKSRV